jgi:hypothetical protein
VYAVRADGDADRAAPGDCLRITNAAAAVRRRPAAAGEGEPAAIEHEGPSELMMTLRRLELDDEIRERIAAVERALEAYDPGGDSASYVELPKLELADAVLHAVAVQRQRLDQRLRRLPVRARVALGEVSLRPKRSRRA